MKRVLVAGFGNELRGDDGFGVLVVKELARRGPPPGVTLLEIGTGGLRLAQELLSPYDHLIVVDAVTRGGPPGTVYTLEITGVEMPPGVDLHAAVPDRALAVAKAMGVLPPLVHLVGCEPGEVDDLLAPPTAAVSAAIPAAVARVHGLAATGGEA